MALTWSDEDGATSTSGTTSLTTPSTVNAAVGDLLVVQISADNAGTSGASSISSVTDSAGNTWTQRAIVNNDGGASANNGITLGVFEAPITIALVNGTVTVNFSPSTAQKVFNVIKAVPGAGETVAFVAVDATGATGTGSTYTAATVSVTNGHSIIGMAAVERGDAITGDSDTTNGNWSAVIQRNVGGANGASAAWQVKTVNATGNQSWAATDGSGDWAATYIIYQALAIVQAPVSSWEQPWSMPVRSKPALRSAMQPFAFYVGAAPFPETVFYDKYAFEWSQPYPAKRRVRAGGELFQALQPTPIISIEWFQALTEPRRYKATLKPAQVPTFFFQPWPVIIIDWFNPLSEPKRFKPALRTAAQMTLVMPVQPDIEAMMAWFAALAEPRRYKPAVKAGQIPTFFFQPGPIIKIDWFAALSEPKRSRPKLREGSQMALTLHPSPVVSFSWIYGFSEPVRKKPSLIEAAKEKSSHMIFVNVPASTGPLFIRVKGGKPATFWKGRSDGR
jgi:hypothetical protein